METAVILDLDCPLRASQSSNLSWLDSLRDRICELLHGFGDGHSANIAALAHRTGDRLRVDLILTDDGEHRHLFLVGDLDLLSNRASALIHLRSDPLLERLLDNLLTERSEVVAHLGLGWEREDENEWGIRGRGGLECVCVCVPGGGGGGRGG